MSPDLCDHGIMGGRAWGRCETCATPEKRAEWVARQAATCEHGLGKATCERCVILALTAEAASLRATIEELEVARTYSCCGALMSGPHSSVCAFEKAEQRIEQAESGREAAIEALGVMRDELIAAGGKPGDRVVALENLRALVREREAAFRALEEIAKPGRGLEPGDSMEVREEYWRRIAMSNRVTALRTLARNPEGPKPEPCAYCEEDDCPTPRRSTRDGEEG